MKKLFLMAMLAAGSMAPALAGTSDPVLVDKATITTALLKMPYDFITRDGQYLIFYNHDVGSGEAFDEAPYRGEDRFNVCMSEHKSMSSMMNDRYELWIEDEQGESLWIQFNSDSLSTISPYVFKDSSMRTGYIKYCRGNADSTLYGSLQVDSFDKIKKCIDTETF